jgi:hypothetical protein
MTFLLLRDAFRGVYNWFAYRNLVALACCKSFEDINPDKVARVIQRFAKSSLYFDADIHTEYARDPRPLTCKHALMRIWELSEIQAEQPTKWRFKWHRIMVYCNALYTKFQSNAERLVGQR